MRGGEAPIKSHVRLIALLLPGGHFPCGRFDIGKPSRQALPFQHTQLTFGDVQPRAMFRVVPVRSLTPCAAVALSQGRTAVTAD